MKYFIGLDIGTTNIGAVLINSDNGELICSVNVKNDSNVIFQSDKKSLWAEQSPEIILKRVFDCLTDLKNRCSVPPREIGGIGITGQMHGMLLVDENKKPFTNLITWEDKRCLTQMLGSNQTYLDEVLYINRNRQSNNGCIPSAGYMGCTLFWLSKNNLLPKKNIKTSFIADYICSILTGQEIYTDATDAASSGVFDVLNNCWDDQFISSLNIPYEILPESVLSGKIIGFLQKYASEKIGLPQGIPVSCPVGDNQASLLGSLRDWNDIVINIGTGSQISCITNFFNPIDNLEIRPFFDGNYLLVGAGLCGGRAYFYLYDFLKDAGKKFFSELSDQDLYKEMNTAAEKIPQGADELICDTRFEGTRENPEIRGAFKNISKRNFTTGHFCRAVLEGIVRELYGFYLKFDKKLEKEQYITASGNAVRKNPLMGKIISIIFNLPVRIPLYEEEASYGAALLSSVRTGTISNFKKSAELIKYRDVIYP